MVLIFFLVTLPACLLYAFYWISRKLESKYRLFFLLLLSLTIPLYDQISKGDNVAFIFILFIMAAVLFYSVLKIGNKNNKIRKDLMDRNKMMIQVKNITQIEIQIIGLNMKEQMRMACLGDLQDLCAGKDGLV